MPELLQEVRTNFESIHSRIDKAARKAGRDPSDVRIIVVTKSQPPEILQAAVKAGAEYLGENYAEEAIAKLQALGSKLGVAWHMIGHVQSWKARLVVENFDWIDSVDSVKLAEKYNRVAGELGKRLPILLELNVGGEATKYGWDISPTGGIEPILADVERAISFPNLEVRGLMTMPPLFEDAELTRPYFKMLRVIQGELMMRYPDQNWKELSMGTSNDFEAAIAEGSTMVRIGRAILGPRPERSWQNSMDESNIRGESLGNR
jgi:pyridoxal phosphate enzyme (YggS family)